MTSYDVQLGSFENADYSLGKRKGEKSVEQQSAEVFLHDRSAGSFITRFRSRLFNVSHVFTGVLFALFVLVLLIAIVIGSNVYKSLYAEEQQISHERIAMSLLYNTIRTVDAENAMEITIGPEGPALILSEYTITGTYETRLYLYQGALVQEYAYNRSAYHPEEATKLLETETLDFTYRDGLLTITTSSGQADIALRCAKEAK